MHYHVSSACFFLYVSRIQGEFLTLGGVAAGKGVWLVMILE